MVVMTTWEHELAEADGDRLARKVDEVTAAFERLADVLSMEDELTMLLRRVCQQAIHAIPGADMASVTLLREGDPNTVGETVAVTDDQAIEIDKAQYAAGEGPCIEAGTASQVVRATAAEAGRRWPDFAVAAGEPTVASFLSAPLFIDSRYHGSLNLYGHAEHGFGKLDAALLELYTTAAEAGLRSAQRYRQTLDLVAQLREALTSRAVIDQAKGVLMAARRISADEAFALLVEQSQQENVKVRDLAERFIADLISR